MQETWVQSLGREDLLEKGMATHSSILAPQPPKKGLKEILDFPGGSDSKASACNVGDPVRFLGREDPLEKEMATHSSTLAWKIPWTEEPDRLQSMGSQRVGHN